MKLHEFISRLNWRQVAIHFIATWFFMYSFQTLAVLYNTNLVEIIRQSGKDSLPNTLNENEIFAADLTYFNMWTGVARTVGLIVAFIISLIISFKRKWFWLNSLIVLIIAFILGWFNLLGWAYFKKIFLMPGKIFDNVILEFLANGFIILSVGLLTFFLAKPNRFIAMGEKANL